uniref:Uncharacterized protein n=1 Tax=Glossina palpalis gambiensis TaxID=67801 RepID=A0A1B0BRJ0_9MUSC
MVPTPLGFGNLSGLMSFNIQTASMTIRTPIGGLFIVFTTAISAVVKVFKAAKAALRMGRASPSFASHSSLMAIATAACSLADASSCLTNPRYQAIPNDQHSPGSFFAKLCHIMQERSYVMQLASKNFLNLLTSEYKLIEKRVLTKRTISLTSLINSESCKRTSGPIRCSSSSSQIRLRCSFIIDSGTAGVNNVFVEIRKSV